MKNQWLAWAKERGFHIAALNSNTFEEVCSTIENLEISGGLDLDFSRREIHPICKKTEKNLSEFKTILLVAMPRPAQILQFQTASTTFTSIIPPTYMNYRDIWKILLADLAGFVGKDFPQTEIFDAPLKSLAVKAGLASYGKNNITYIEGFGSYYQLCGFLVKAEVGPFLDMEEKAGKQMETCKDCRACMNHCPTHAIQNDRFLLHAEKCLTLFSETPGELPPVQGKFKNHHCCIVGCMVCQAVCPANAGKLIMEEAPVSFDPCETQRILDFCENRPDPGWKKIKEKLKVLGMQHYAPVLSRNLHFIMSI